MRDQRHSPALRSVHADGAPAQVMSRLRTLTPAAWCGTLIAGVVVLWFAARAWAWRWLADDGMIVHRTVRNVLAGNGPVFNVGERVESNTSVLWTFVVALGGVVTDDLDRVAILQGIGLSVVGLVGMLAGCAVLYGNARTRLFVPVGVAIYCALPAARDFATSGLENGLVLAWVGTVWWLLCRWATDTTGRRGTAATAFLVGLGPLIRPEAMAVTTLGLAYLLVTTTDWRARGRIVAWAATLPVVYQVFRMGFYGLPVPHTAMAKEAAVNRLEQGLFYWDYSLKVFNVAWLWVGLGVLGSGLIVTAVCRLGRSSRRIDRHQVRRLGPVVVVLLSAAVLIAYSLYNGGDYMRGRMTLFPLALILAPVSWLPMPRLGDRPGAAAIPRGLIVAGAAVTVLWSVSAVLAAPPAGQSDTTEIRGIVDERAYKVAFTGTAHPDSTEVYARIEEAPALIDALATSPKGTVLLARRDNKTWVLVPPAPDSTDPTTVVAHHLGIDAALAPLDVRVWDYVGLATPIAGHIEGITDGRIGHDKDMPGAWAVAASSTRPAPSMPDDLDPTHVEAARTALACDDFRDALRSATGPLTARQFLSNIVGATSKYTLRFPSDPVAAARHCP